MDRIISGVVVGPAVKRLMGLKLARLLYAASGRNIEVASLMVDANGPVVGVLADVAAEWTIRTISQFQEEVGADRLPSDDEIAELIMDEIGTDPTEPCGCCGEYH